MYSDNQQKIIEEALRQTELQLEDLQAIATAAEARAFQFSSTTVLVATLATAFAERLPSPNGVYLGAVGLIAASSWAIFSVLPRTFHIRGLRWSEWKPHVTDNDEHGQVLESQAAENDQRIQFNFQRLHESSSHFTLSFRIAFASIGVTILAQLIAISRSN